MQSKAKTVAEYLKELPADRREALQAVRDVIRKNLDSGFEEGMQYGMIGYYVPHRLYPNGYHCDPRQPVPYASLASQKNHMALYLMSVYAGPDENWFATAWKKTGKKLDMGKSCVRFKSVEDLALDVIGEVFRRSTAKSYIQYYESNIMGRSATTAKASSSGAKKVSAAKPAAKAVVGSKAPAKKSAAAGSTPVRKKAPVKKAASGKAPVKKAAARKTSKTSKSASRA